LLVTHAHNFVFHQSPEDNADDSMEDHSTQARDKRVAILTSDKSRRDNREDSQVRDKRVANLSSAKSRREEVILMIMHSDDEQFYY
jgi:hypothetical protein